MNTLCQRRAIFNYTQKIVTIREIKASKRRWLDKPFKSKPNLSQVHVQKASLCHLASYIVMYHFTKIFVIFIQRYIELESFCKRLIYKRNWKSIKWSCPMEPTTETKVDNNEIINETQVSFYFTFQKVVFCNCTICVPILNGLKEEKECIFH